MRPPRISIRGLMVFVVAIALGLAALRFSTPNVAGTAILATLFGLGLAILAALYLREARRAFWVGFALMGWGYLGFSSSSWILPDEIPLSARPSMGSGIWAPSQPKREHWLGTTIFLDAIHASVQASSGGSGIPSTEVASFLGFTDPRTSAITAALNRPLKIPFAAETPLEDVVKYIKASTSSPELPDGIPIYVNPIGLQEAEKTLASPISLELDSVPLRRSLGLMLRQLDLRYSVNDGLVTITSVDPPNATTENATRVESFRRVGHCLFALFFGLVGGLTARTLHATRPTAPSDPPASR